MEAVITWKLICWLVLPMYVCDSFQTQYAVSLRRVMLCQCISGCFIELAKHQVTKQ